MVFFIFRIFTNRLVPSYFPNIEKGIRCGCLFPITTLKVICFCFPVRDVRGYHVSRTGRTGLPCTNQPRRLGVRRRHRGRASGLCLSS